MCDVDGALLEVGLGHAHLLRLHTDRSVERLARLVDVALLHTRALRRADRNLERADVEAARRRLLPPLELGEGADRGDSVVIDGHDAVGGATAAAAHVKTMQRPFQLEHAHEVVEVRPRIEHPQPPGAAAARVRDHRPEAVAEEPYGEEEDPDKGGAAEEDEVGHGVLFGQRELVGGEVGDANLPPTARCRLHV